MGWEVGEIDGSYARPALRRQLRRRPERREGRDEPHCSDPGARGILPLCQGVSNEVAYRYTRCLRRVARVVLGCR